MQNVVKHTTFSYVCSNVFIIKTLTKINTSKTSKNVFTSMIYPVPTLIQYIQCNLCDIDERALDKTTTTTIFISLKTHTSIHTMHICTSIQKKQQRQAAKEALIPINAGRLYN